MSIKEQARVWFVRLEQDQSAETKAEFESWLAESSEHRREFEWIEKVYAGSEVLKDSPKFGIDREASARPSRSRHWWMVGTAVAAAVAVAVIAFGAGGAPIVAPFSDGSMSARAAEPLVTHRGEIRSFTLADGSTATLDTDSRVEVSMTETERHMHLSQGRARFEVAPDSRPFRVRIGTSEVTTSKGVLDVAYEEGQGVMIHIVSGDADVRPTSQDTAAPKPLRQGELMRYPVNDYHAATIQLEPAARPERDWPNGLADYRSIRLDKLVAEANRYAEKPIIIDDSATAALTASGLFRIGNTDVFVERIAESLNLSVSRREDGIHLRKR